MNFPLMKSTPTYTLNIPKLSGGLNLRDGLSGVQDNQLTDAKNVWFKDGALRTRPRLNSSENKSDYIGSHAISPETKCYVYQDIKYFEDRGIDTSTGEKKGGGYNLVAAEMRGYGNGKFNISVALWFANEAEPSKKITVGSVPFPNDYMINATYLLYQFNNDIYCLWSGENEGGSKNHGIVKFVENDGVWNACSVLDEDVYAPIVYDHCKTDGTLVMIDSDGDEISYSDISYTGTQLYSHNLISNYYKAVFSTVNKSLFTSEITKLPMKYMLPEELTSDMAGKTVKAKITQIDGTVAEHCVILDRNGYGCEVEPNKADNLIMTADRWYIFFEENYNEEYTVMTYLTKEDFLEDNMELTLPRLNPEENIYKVFSMTRSTWFGGNFHGLYGGTRLFLCGNEQENEKSLMVWSYINNPLYFPEGCTRYVDDTTQKVTAFGKMYDTLIVFKERKLFQARYSEANAPGAEDFLNQGVIDLASQVEYFPLTLVNDSIGCDCPDTIQLCRNRLVWANSNGKVYTLISQNQYNERAVFNVSEMVESRLKAEKNLKKACSADYEGHYILMVDDHLYLMDYNCYGFNAVASYSKTEDANIHIPWYYWELPVVPAAIGTVGDCLIFPTLTKSGIDGDHAYISLGVLYMDGSYGDDAVNRAIYNGDEWVMDLKSVHINSFIQTKLFDFGQPARLKSIPIVNFSFGYNDGKSISVEFISERKVSDEHKVTLDGESAEIRSPSYIHPCRLFPYTKGTVSFGARVSCNGELVISSMSLQYKQLGGAK